MGKIHLFVDVQINEGSKAEIISDLLYSEYWEENFNLQPFRNYYQGEIYHVYRCEKNY